MLTQTFPSLKPKAAPWQVPVVYGRQQQQQQQPPAGASVYIYNRQPQPEDRIKAAKLKLNISEYVRRDDILHDLYKKANCRTGETVYPRDAKKFLEYGPLIVVNITKTMQDWGVSEEWPEDDIPFTLLVRPADASKNIQPFLCTAGWIQTQKHLC